MELLSHSITRQFGKYSGRRYVAGIVGKSFEISPTEVDPRIKTRPTRTGRAKTYAQD